MCKGTPTDFLYKYKRLGHALKKKKKKIDAINTRKKLFHTNKTDALFTFWNLEACGVSMSLTVQQLYIIVSDAYREKPLN